MNGNCKNVMNMSQSDQSELWHSVMNGNMETYQRVSSKLKLATIDDESRSLCSQKYQQSFGETDFTAQVKTDKCFTLHDALKTLVPELFLDEPLTNVKLGGVDFEEAVGNPNEDVSSDKVVEDQGQNEYEHPEAGHIPSSAEIKLIRIQGIEPKLEIPFSWVANNLINPDYFLHICVYVKVAH
ncbi:Autophagy protein Apg5 family isoform 3 [Hibiscus syriacus]|uniref:Autophagy protein 5 n=1 Tax=Hibiscus syriacus TaxID=106335 RepID=A0A6A2ZU11_HIBSY|nr:Autophagy protein Apg5 family isoform 3 [Hibiscus syriacus]